MSTIESQIRQVELDLLSALNSADAKAMFNHMHPDCDSFWPGGQQLYNPEHSRRAIHDTFGSGFWFDLQIQDLSVKVYGNASIATAYLAGTAITPDGKTSVVNWRMSIIRIKQGDEWKVVHWHESPLVSDT